MRRRLFASLLSLAAVCPAVEPVLVADLVKGAASAFTNWDFEDRSFRGSARLGSDLYFAASSDSSGRELYRVHQGQLQRVADLEPGTASSNPGPMVELGGALYVAAKTTAQGAGIWKTDGTTTTLAIATKNTTSQPDNLLATKTGRLFFSQGSQLFVSDGTSEGTREITIPATPVVTEDDGLGPTLVVSGDSLVFLATKGDTLQLWSAGHSQNLLASSYAGGRISRTGGLRRVGAGFAFCLTRLTSPAPNRLLSWKPGSTKLQVVLTSSGDTLVPNRFLPVGEDLALAYVYQDGFYRYNGSAVTSLSSSFPEALVSFDPLSHVNFAGELLFRESDQAVKTTVSITNGTTVTPIVTGSPYLSNFVAQGDVAFFMNGITNGFTPMVHYVKAGTHATGVLWTSTKSASGTPKLALVGVQGNRLYLTSSLDTKVGLELYSLALPSGLVDTTLSRVSPRTREASIRATTRGVRIDAPGTWTVELLDPQGRILSRQILTTTGFHAWPVHHRGIAIARMRGPNGAVFQEPVQIQP